MRVVTLGVFTPVCDTQMFRFTLGRDWTHRQFNHVIIILQVRSPISSDYVSFWLYLCGQPIRGGFRKEDMQKKGPSCLLNLPITLLSLLSLFKKYKSSWRSD
jgi:hypothetical protein